MNDSATVVLCVVIVVVVFTSIRILCTMMCRNSGYPQVPAQPRVRRRVVQRIRIDPANAATSPTSTDRADHIYTISDDLPANNSANRFSDFFYLEPTSEEAARIRAQLEKDKDLPTYDEAMGLTPPEVGAVSAVSSTTTIEQHVPLCHDNSSNVAVAGTSTTSVSTV